MKKNWCQYTTLLKAFDSAKERKSYHKIVMKYEANLSENLENLLVRLDSETYQPQPYREFYVYDPKTRLIQAPAFEDRIVHHALMGCIRPAIDRKLIHDTYACRIGKGARAASARMTHFVRGLPNGWALKIDVKKFFYSIDHERIGHHLAKIIPCEKTVNLIKMFYENPTGKGLPLGNATSQILANLALNPIDQFIKRELKIKRYIRYMDDMILLHEDREYLKECLFKVKEVLAVEKLEANKRTSIRRISKGITFVGYRHFVSHTILKPANITKIRRALKKINDRETVVSYLAFAKDTASFPLVVKMARKAAPGVIPVIQKFAEKHRKAA